MLWFVAPVAAQQVWYEGPAVWMPQEGATEKFQHARRDTNLQLTGKYFWQLKSELPGGGLRVNRIAASFKNGRVEGPLQFSQHDLQLAIGDMAADSLLVHAKGEQLRLQAFFQQGKPAGQWVLESGPFPRGAALAAKVTYVPAMQQFTYAAAGVQLSGKVTGSGALQGPWKWQKDSLLYDYQYNSGILTAIRQGENTLAKQSFLKLQQTISAEPQLRWQPDTAAIFNPGLAASDSILGLQQPWGLAFTDFTQQLASTWTWLQRHPLIQMPVLPSISGVFIPLEESQLPTSIFAALKMYRDSTQKCLQAPLLLLHMGQDAVLDSVYGQARLAQWRADSLLQRFAHYLSPASRRQLLLHAKTDSVLNHAAVLVALTKQAKQQLQTLETMAELLFRYRAQFREEAALGALEAAWWEALERLQEDLKPDSVYVLGLQLWAGMQKDYLQQQKEAYVKLDNLETRRQFLRAALDETEGLIRYFEQQAYPFLSTAPSDFQKAYTQMLYNPYMGVNNIEQVNRRRLLSYFKVDFWPWWTQQMLTIERPQQLFEVQETAKLLYEAIMALGSDSSREADRLEKRIRREKSPERVVRLLLDYQQN